jgi:hypothetical protein
MPFAAGVEMGRPKRKPLKNPPTYRTIGIRATTEWSEWLEKVAQHCRTDVSKLVDQAVLDYARSHGFDETPPSRI